MKGYISIREASCKWGVSERWVNQYCSKGRISGAERFGWSWAIPETAEKPTDPRKETKGGGGLEKRVRHCKRRLEQYIEGTIKSIEELEEPLMHPHGKGCDYNSAPLYKSCWKETSTANVI